MRVFEESQKFNQWWFIALQVVVFVIALFSFVKTYQEGNFENNPDAWIGLTISFGVFILMMVFVFSMQLKTRIDEKGISYQFLPFHFKKRWIKWSELSHCAVRKYNPIQEYGGWGIRGFGKKGFLGLYKKRGMAYNVRGNLGIQLEFNDGGKLLIGTQQADKVSQAIATYFKNREEKL